MSREELKPQQNNMFFWVKFRSIDKNRGSNICRGKSQYLTKSRNFGSYKRNLRRKNIADPAHTCYPWRPWRTVCHNLCISQVYHTTYQQNHEKNENNFLPLVLYIVIRCTQTGESAKTILLISIFDENNKVGTNVNCFERT